MTDQDHPATPGDAAPTKVEAYLLLLGAEQVAAVLGIDRATVYRMFSAGELPQAVKIGRLTKWKRADIEQWVGAHQTIGR